MEHEARITEQVEHGMKKMVTKVFKVIFIVILAIGLVFLMGYVVQYLWNWLMPELFGLPVIGYWKAIGILLLSKIIFGFGGGRHKKSRSRARSKKKCRSLKKDLTKWKQYEQFWEEEGESAYEAYKKRKNME